MPILAFSVAITTSQQPSRTALPAKQRPDAIPTSGASPDSLPNKLKAGVIRLPE